MKDRILKVNDDIVQAASKASRNINDVLLLGVTKTHDIQTVCNAHENGIIAFGESYVQEFIDKYDENLSLTWHFIGQLQSNKVKYIVDKVSMIHSLDRMSLAKEISKRCINIDKVMDVLVQVNIGMEQQKGGIAPEDVAEFIDSVNVLKGIRVCGLMCIHPFGSPEESRVYFSRMKKLYDDLSGKGYCMEHLSMGMSADYIQAVEEGATIVRVGSALFGNRIY